MRWRPAASSLTALLVAGLVLALDQLSKALVVQRLQPGLSVPFVPGLLRLQWVANTGAAFSILRDSTAVLTLMSVAVCLALVVWLWRQPPATLWQRLAFGLLLGGAAGNGLDRLRLGSVVDFLELVPIHFPIFNLADVAINLAVLCFVIDLFGSRSPRPHA